MLYYTGMTTSELISYLRKQIQNNTPKDLIISKLLSAGWHREDIEEGFSAIEIKVQPEVFIPPVSREIPIVNKTPVINTIENKEKTVDNYREPLVGDNIFEIKKAEQKISIPVIEEVIEEPKSEPVIIQAPKVWTPMSVPIKEKPQDEDIIPKTTEVAVQSPELQTKKPAQSVADILGREELVPALIPKIAINPFNPFNPAISVNKDTPPKEVSPVALKPTATPTPQQSTTNYLASNLPKIAMISTYQKDVQSFKNKLRDEIVPTNNFVPKSNKKAIKWVIVIILVLALASLITFVFTSGYINIKNFNLIKKDPKVLLLENSKVLSSLKSYKTETNLEISSPSFANISYGLLSGEAVISNDKDSISINTLGIINKNGKDLLSDNFVTIKGSILPNYITTDIKNDGTNLFISVPDLSEIIKENSLEPSVVKISEQQFNLIPPLFSTEIETQLNKINIYKILSSGVSSFIDNNTLDAYNDLINSVEITEKGQENIKGIDTYHYSINADRQLAKNLLSKISDNLVNNLTTEDKDKLVGILGALTINSFDVWVGKGDNNIYQYSTVIDIPLSKIIGFEDKSIGDNKVSISWKTTYYDFNIANNIFMPDKSITVDDFVQNIKETKMKNDVSSFKKLATDLYDDGKVYGSKSNTNGSCMNPISGSLFSPTGHTKKSATSVSAISSFLNDILGTTNGSGFCYSTPQAWSLTIPIADSYDLLSATAGEYNSYFCIDSTGVKQDLTTPPTSVVCK